MSTLRTGGLAHRSLQCSQLSLARAKKSLPSQFLLLRKREQEEDREPLSEHCLFRNSHSSRLEAEGQTQVPQPETPLFAHLATGAWPAPQEAKPEVSLAQAGALPHPHSLINKTNVFVVYGLLKLLS